MPNLPSRLLPLVKRRRNRDLRNSVNVSRPKKPTRPKKTRKSRSATRYFFNELNV